MYNSELNNLFILSASCFFSYYSWEFIQALLYSLLEIDTNEYFCFYLLETRSSFTAGYGIDTTWVFLVDALKRDLDSPPPQWLGLQSAREALLVLCQSKR